MHHEQTERNQRLFMDEVNKLTKVIGDMGNPFQEKSKDLLTLDTKDIAHPNATERIHTHFVRGRIRFDEFIHCLGSEENLTFYEPIKKIKIDFFRQVPAPVDGKQKVLKDSSQGSSYQAGAEYPTYRSFFSITISHSLPQ